MYEEHSLFEKPTDENAKIWRYLDFTKFVSLLDRRALFFPRADMLADPFEGSYSRANVALRPTVYKDLPKESLEKMFEQHRTLSREIRRFTLINCWHIGEHESAAMWRLYLKSDEGVAVQSTFARLADSFRDCAEHTVHIGKVNYIDYETDWLPEGNSFYPFLHKRTSFEHERELRAIIQKLPVADGGGVDWTKELFDVGVYVPVDLDALIESVFVSPTAPTWFGELVRCVTRKYGLEKEVMQSQLGQDPVY